MYHQIARNNRNSIIVVAFFLVLWIAVGAAIFYPLYGQGGARTGAILFGAVAVAVAVGAYYWGGGTVLAAMEAEVADPTEYAKLYATVQALAVGDGIPTPVICIIDDRSLNAFATGRDPSHAAIVVTSGLLQAVDSEQLEGVLAHEMSHIKNFDVRLLLFVTTLVGLAALLVKIIWSPGPDGSLTMRLFYLPVIALLSVIGFVVGPMLQLTLDRQREFLADARAVELTRNPYGLINALKKIARSDVPPDHFDHAVAAMMIDNPSEHHGNWFRHIFATHPPIEQRIAALERLAGAQQI